MKTLKISSLILFTALLLSGCTETQPTQVVQKDIIDAVFASGYIATTDEYLVMAKAEGYLSQQLVEAGDPVSPGDQLFFVSHDVQSANLATAQANHADALRRTQQGSPDLAQAELQIAHARAQLATDQKNFERHKQLVKTNAVSQREYDQAKLQFEASQNQLQLQEKSLLDLKSALKLNLDQAANQLKIQQENSRDHFLTSAIQGQILNIYKQQGELVRKGEAIAKIGGGEAIGRLYIAEEDITLVQPGQTVQIALNTHKDQTFEARISKILPAFDEQQQSFIAEARFTEQPHRLFPGTQLQANIVVDHRENALIIPADHLLPGDSVRLSDQSTIAVQTGLRTEAWVEITSGLQNGNTLIPSK